MAKKKKREVTVIVNGQDCTGAISAEGEITPDDLQAIAQVFQTASSMMRANSHLHGSIQCVYEGEILAEVGFCDPVKWDEENGLPTLVAVQRQS